MLPPQKGFIMVCINYESVVEYNGYVGYGYVEIDGDKITHLPIEEYGISACYEVGESCKLQIIDKTCKYYTNPVWELIGYESEESFSIDCYGEGYKRNYSTGFIEELINENIPEKYITVRGLL